MRRTVEVAPDGPRPSISLRPVPPCEPPFDDELEPAVWATAHQLALDWSALSPPRPAASPIAVPGAGSGSPEGCERRPGPASADDGSRPVAPRRPSVPVHRSGVAGASHEAKLAVHRFVRLCVEVLNGHRPPAHLRQLSLPSEAAAVVAQGLAGARRVTELRRAALRPGRRPPRRPAPVAVIRLRMCEPRPGAVEAAVALVTGERTWALALRLELHHESWSVTALRLV